MTLTMLFRALLLLWQCFSKPYYNYYYYYYDYYYYCYYYYYYHYHYDYYDD